MKKITLIFLLALSFQYCSAQSANDNQGKELFDHYIGVQINGLIRQVLNFNNSSATTSGNPYLLTYDMISKKSGWGFRVGIGYSSSKNFGTSVNNENTGNNNDLQARIGVEKIFKLSKKWNAGAGIDLVYNYFNNNSTNNQYYHYDTSITSTKTLVSSYGGGTFGILTYSITNKILVGTECSFYYVTGNKNAIADNTTTNQGMSPIISETKQNSGISQAGINLPIVFYLSVKF